MSDEKNVKPHITILHADLERPRESDLTISTNGAISVSAPLARPVAVKPKPPETEK